MGSGCQMDNMLDGITPRVESGEGLVLKEAGEGEKEGEEM